MNIDYIILAQLLKTNLSNIRKVEQDEEKIIIQFRDSKDKVVIDIEAYNNYVEDLDKSRKANSLGTKQSIGLFLMIVAACVGLNGYAMNTNVDGSKILKDPNLVDQQNKQLQLGGIFLVVGTIFYCSDKKEKGND
jgi:hypothetical protein